MYALKLLFFYSHHWSQEEEKSFEFVVVAVVMIEDARSLKHQSERYHWIHSTAYLTFTKKNNRRNSKINYLKKPDYIHIWFHFEIVSDCEKTAFICLNCKMHVCMICTLYVSISKHILNYRYWRKKNERKKYSQTFVTFIFREKINECNRRKRRKKKQNGQYKRVYVCAYTALKYMERDKWKEK